GGVLIDKFGGVLTFCEIKLLAVYNHDDTNPLLVLGKPAGVDQIITMTSVGVENLVIPPLSFVMLGTPGNTWATPPGADILFVSPGANTIVYDIIIVGVGTRDEDEPTTTTGATTTT
ncbi:unnamed protein product, partial [marine sediment metagenome]